MSKLTYEQSAALVQDHRNGSTVKELCEKYSLWPTSVITRLKTAKAYQPNKVVVPRIDITKNTPNKKVVEHKKVVPPPPPAHRPAPPPVRTPPAAQDNSPEEEFRGAAPRVVLPGKLPPMLPGEPREEYAARCTKWIKEQQG